MEIHFSIPGPPKAKGRPRVTVRNGHARAFTPKATRDYERLVSRCAQMAREGVFEGPVRVELLVVVARPKRLMRKSDPDGLLPCPTRPDIDNYVKALLDGCACLWGDDAQVVDLVARKRYSERGGEPRMEVLVCDL